MDKPTYAQAIRMAEGGELLHTELKLEAFIDPSNGNHFFVVYDPKTGEKVLVDRYARFVEQDGIALPVLDRPKIEEFLGRILKKARRGVAGILSITDEPIVRKLASVFDADLSEIDDLRCVLSNKKGIEQVLEVIQRYGSERAQSAGEVVEDALLDGRVDLSEWKRIYDAIRGK